MPSLSNVIKNTNIKAQGSKQIKTDYEIIDEAKEGNAKINMESYENLASTMLENARHQSEAILSKSYEEAQLIERNAYLKGYEKGSAEGYRDAYKETIERASQEAEFLLNNANKILHSAKQEYEKYLMQKKLEIVNLAISIAEKVMQSKIDETDSLDHMVFEAISDSRKTETFIVKVNPHYVEELNSRVFEWKERLVFKGDIFIIADEAMDKGNAVIERNNGKTAVGIDVGMESIRKALL